MQSTKSYEAKVIPEKNKYLINYIIEKPYRHHQTLLLPRVTEILKQTENEEDRKRLIRWKKKLDALHEKGKSELNAEEYANQARERGTKLHEDIEKYIKEMKEPEDNPLWRPVAPIVKAIAHDIMELEKVVWCPRYAGRMDCKAIWEDKITIFDWTTSDNMKLRPWLQEKFIQAAAYLEADNFCNGTNEAEQITIVCVSPGRCQIFSEDARPHIQEWYERLRQWENKEVKT